MSKRDYKTMLVVVKGEKSDEKDDMIDGIIKEIQTTSIKNGNCLHSDIDKLSKCFDIKRDKLFKKQRTIIEQVANLGDVNIIINVVDCYDEKWQKIANKYDLGFSIINFKSKIDKELDKVQKRIDDLESSINNLDNQPKLLLN